MQSGEKRVIATLIPYRKENGVLSFYLQRRDKDAKRLPDMFGLFGGGLDKGESSEAAVVREIKEELDFKLEGHIFFNRYEFLSSINSVFLLEVGHDFESKVTVLEGQYGKFFSETEAENESLLSDTNKLILKQTAKFIKGELTKLS
jgi:8-oxo-dGTP pyrophosphatase MutT (NUDIX family)